MRRPITKTADFLTEAEQMLIFGTSPKSLEKQPVGFRLTKAALEILDRQAKKIGVGRTQALEYLLRRIDSEDK